jgi:hypothetical protein
LFAPAPKPPHASTTHDALEQCINPFSQEDNPRSGRDRKFRFLVQPRLVLGLPPVKRISQLLLLLSGRAATCTALAGVVFACRCWLIAAWGSPVPFWDQWGVEGPLYHAWLTDSLRWSDLFSSHNEHRIALTKLADLVLFVACGGWNPWAQQLLNGALHALTAGLLAAAFWDKDSPRGRGIFLVGITILFCSTAGWQNALWGFQSQVYFASLCAVVGFIALASFPPPRAALASDPWARTRGWLAFPALLLALVSNAGGLLAVMVALGLSWPRDRTLRTWITWGAVAAILAVGVALRVDAPHHAPLHAQSVEQFLQVFSRGLSWPHVNSAWASLGLQIPLIWLCLRRWRSTSFAKLTSADRCACALAAFAALQAAAVAFTRGAGLPEYRPLSRYQDPLILGSAAQLYAAVRLAVETGRPGRLLLIGWSSLALMGLISLTATQLSLNLPYKRAQDREGLAQIRAYLKTSDANVFAAGAPTGGPDSNAAEIKHVLDAPALRPVLPQEFHDDVPRPWPIAYYRLFVGVAFAIFGAALAVSSFAQQEDFTTAPRRQA